MNEGYLILWISIGIITLVMDLATSSFLFVWFTIGSVAALIAQVLGYSFNGQLITFIAVSALFMAVGYPIVKRTIKKTVRRVPTMEEGYIGHILIVDNDIIEKAIVKFEGIYWTVKSEGEEIKNGDKAKIIGIEGNKLIIKKI